MSQSDSVLWLKPPSGSSQGSDLLAATIALSGLPPAVVYGTALVVSLSALRHSVVVAPPARKPPLPLA